MRPEDNINKFEDQLQQVFSGFEIEAEPAVWTAVEKELLQEKKKRMLFIWMKWTGFCFMLMVATTAFLYFQNSHRPLLQVENGNAALNQDLLAVSSKHALVAVSDIKAPLIKEEPIVVSPLNHTYASTASENNRKLTAKSEIRRAINNASSSLNFKTNEMEKRIVDESSWGEKNTASVVIGDIDSSASLTDLKKQADFFATTQLYLPLTMEHTLIPTINTQTPSTRRQAQFLVIYLQAGRGKYANLYTPSPPPHYYTVKPNSPQLQTFDIKSLGPPPFKNYNTYSLGVNYQRQLLRRFSMEAGVSCDVMLSHKTEKTFEGHETKLCIGIPVLVNYSLLHFSRFSFYVSSGLLWQQMVSREYTDNIGTAYKSTEQQSKTSVLLGTGVNMRMDHRLSFFVEPGVNYIFWQKKEYINHSEKYFFRIRGGIRIGL